MAVGPAGHASGCIAIDPEGQFGLILRLVHGGVGGRIDNQIRLRAVQQGFQPPLVGHVQCDPGLDTAITGAEIDRGHIAQRSEAGIQLLAELASSPGE